MSDDGAPASAPVSSVQCAHASVPLGKQRKRVRCVCLGKGQGVAGAASR